MLLEPVVIITSEVRPLSCLNICNLDRLCMQLLVTTVLSVILELQLPWPFGRAGSVTKSLFAFPYRSRSRRSSIMVIETAYRRNDFIHRFDLLHFTFILYLYSSGYVVVNLQTSTVILFSILTKKVKLLNNKVKKMIQKLSSEIVNGALTKAGVYNVDFLTQLTLTNALNDAYRSAYQHIATSDANFYAVDYTLTQDDISEYKDNESAYPYYDLPNDIYLVKSVMIKSVEIPRCPPREVVPGTYRIVNNKFIYYGNPNASITIEYIPTPQTITTPAPSIELTLDPAIVTEWGKVTEKGFYYKTNVGQFFFNFSTNESESTNLFKEKTLDYGDGTLDENDWTIKDSDGDVIWDLNDDFSVGDLNPIVDVVVDDPYMMISYEDGTILVLQDDKSTIWNIKARTGHKTLGRIVGLKTNDETLYGCLYIDEDGILYHSSFVPDTLLNYPTNALFTMLEVQLALLVGSMNNVQLPEYITTTLKDETTKEFFDELRQNRNPVRVSNQRNIVRRGL